MKARTKEREEARKLRRKGYSVGGISEILGISKGSISPWVKDVSLTDKQRKRLDIEGEKKRIKSHSESFRKKRRKYRKRGQSKKLLKDPMYMSGCMLYWAEGTKKRTSLEFTNTDPDMMLFFCKFLRKYFDVEEDRLKLYVLCYIDDTVIRVDEHKDKVMKYWCDLLDVEPENLRGVAFRKTKSFMKYPYGVCRILIGDLKIIQQIYGTVEKFTGMKEEYCLD